MIVINYRSIVWCAIAVLLLIAGFVAVVANAEPVNQSYISIETPPASNGYIPSTYVPPTVRIEQGQNIYLNGTYDITGVVGWDLGGDNYLAYCGGYDCFEYSKPYLLKLPPPARGSNPSQYNFWIDPSIFASRTGQWNQYSVKSDSTIVDFAPHGNVVAFNVIAQYQNGTFTFPNGTVINQSFVVIGNTTPPKAYKPFILPEKPVSDYLLARGDTFTINDNVTEKIWIFGRNTPLYDYETFNGNLSYNGSVTENLEPGEYYLLKQYPGYNNEFNVRYYEDYLQWHKGWSGNINVEIPGVQPKLVAYKVIDLINKTDDTFKFSKLMVQSPAVTIEGFSEVPMYTNYSRYQEYRDKEGYVSLFDVRGYTNQISGSNITIVLDPDRRTPLDIKSYTFYTNALREYEGNMSYYKCYVPIVWDDMTLGMHTLKVSTDLGATMFYDFPISILPEDSFKPNITVKYAMDRNPWVPTPTPELIIQKETVVVTQQVPVQIQPSDAQIKDAAQKIINKQNLDIEWLILAIIGIIVALALIGWFVWSVWRAKR